MNSATSRDATSTSSGDLAKGSWIVCLAPAVYPLAAISQQPKKHYRIGLDSRSQASERDDSHCHD